MKSLSIQQPSLYHLLLPDGTLVESKLLAFQDVAITPSTLTRAAGDDSEETTRLELLLECLLGLAAGGEPGGLLLLDRLALLDLLLGTLGLPSATDGLTVMCFKPLPEGCSVDLDDGGSRESVGSDQFVVGRVIGDRNDTDFASDALGSPGEVAAVETKGAELPVAAASPHKRNALPSDSGVGRLSSFLEGSVPLLRSVAIGLWVTSYLFLR